MQSEDRATETRRDPQPVHGWRAIPRGVWALGFVSMFMDVSSEMIHALLPVYMVTVLGTSALTVGFIEGIAEATASITKVFSGALSDWLGRRKVLAAVGYGLAALTKPVFPLAPTVGWLIGARFVDRIGKGIRGAPRDALVADLSPAHLRGACYGLRQTLDTIGALLGPLIAIGLMWLTYDNYRAVFWAAVVPGFLSVLIVMFVVRDPARKQSEGKDVGAHKIRTPLSRKELSHLPAVYWWIVLIAAVFTFARFSEAFLVLRAQSVGLSVMLVPAVMVVMNITYALSAYPVGAISDRLRGDRSVMLVLGMAVLILADIILARIDTVSGLMIGTLLWGLHMGLTQGVLAALVADNTPAHLRGTAFGMFNLTSGVALLLASVIAGYLWDLFGAEGTFLAGGGFALAALAGLLTLRHRLRH